MTTTDSATIDGDLTGGVNAANGLTILAGGLYMTGGAATITAGGVAVDTLGATITSSVGTNEVLHVTATSTSYATSSALKMTTATAAAGSYDLIKGVVAGSTEVWAARANGVMLAKGGLDATGGGVSVVTGGLRLITQDVTAGAGLIVKSTTPATSDAAHIHATSGSFANNAVITGATTRQPSSSFYALSLHAAANNLLEVRGDGLTTVDTNLLVLAGGMTVEAGGFVTTDTGVEVATNGMRVNAGGMTITDGALSVKGTAASLITQSKYYEPALNLQATSATFTGSVLSVEVSWFGSRRAEAA